MAKDKARSCLTIGYLYFIDTLVESNQFGSISIEIVGKMHYSITLLLRGLCLKKVSPDDTEKIQKFDDIADPYILYKEIPDEYKKQLRNILLKIEQNRMKAVKEEKPSVFCWHNHKYILLYPPHQEEVDRYKTYEQLEDNVLYMNKKNKIDITFLYDFNRALCEFVCNKRWFY